MVMPDGEVVWFGATPDSGEDVEGYDLRGVIIGSEGMFGIVTRVLLRLNRAPQAYKTMLGIYETVEAASQTVSEIIAAGGVPAAMENMGDVLTQAAGAASSFLCCLLAGS